MIHLKIFCKRQISIQRPHDLNSHNQEGLAPLCWELLRLFASLHLSTWLVFGFFFFCLLLVTIFSTSARMSCLEAPGRIRVVAAWLNELRGEWGLGSWLVLPETLARRSVPVTFFLWHVQGNRSSSVSGSTFTMPSRIWGSLTCKLAYSCIGNNMKACFI